MFSSFRGKSYVHYYISELCVLSIEKCRKTNVSCKMNGKYPIKRNKFLQNCKIQKKYCNIS